MIGDKTKKLAFLIFQVPVINFTKPSLRRKPLSQDHERCQLMFRLRCSPKAQLTKELTRYNMSTKNEASLP